MSIQGPPFLRSDSPLPGTGERARPSDPRLGSEGLVSHGVGVRVPPIVKICGVRTVAQAQAAAMAGADMVGLVFAPSKRRVTLEQAREITTARYARRPRFVGVFANEAPTVMARIAMEARLDLVQLSGAETPEMCADLDVPYSKVVHPREGMTEADLLHIAIGYEGAAFLLIDAAGTAGSLTQWGGGGVAVDWGVAARAVEQLAQREAPVMLAGGLRPDTVAAAVRAVRPWGVDVSSGVETDGVKDEHKIAAFVAAAKGQQGQ